MLAIDEIAHAIGEGKLSRRIFGAVDSNRCVNMRRAARVPARIDSIEVNHAIAVGWLDSATECLIRDVGAGRANLSAERGINAAGIGMPNVDRGIRHWLARIGVNNPKSEARRQAGGSGSNVPAPL